LRILHDNLPGIQLGRGDSKTAVVACADDITIFLTSPTDIFIVQDAIRRYETASGARLNVRKSKAIALGTWDTTVNAMDIPYYTDIKFLGFTITSTVKQSAITSWSTVTGMIHTLAREAYCRDLGLTQCIKYVHDYLLAKVWYTAQIFPATDDCVRQLNSAITWYIWHGEILRVPLSTLQRCRTHGGWDLIDIAAKSQALLFAQLRTQGLKTGTLTAAWLQKWDLLQPVIGYWRH
jgi:hypothetical protein